MHLATNRMDREQSVRHCKEVIMMLELRHKVGGLHLVTHIRAVHCTFKQTHTHKHTHAERKSESYRMWVEVFKHPFFPQAIR